MATGRSSTRRGIHHQQGDSSETNAIQLFIDPMLGGALQIFIEKDVPDRDSLVTLITKHGGNISPGYSGVPYILVDPLLPSGQSLYRQYAGKKGKIVLDYRWAHECIKAQALQTFHTNWAGCKVTGEELNAQQHALEIQQQTIGATSPQARRRSRQDPQQPTMQVEPIPRQIAPPPPAPPPPTLHLQASTIPTVDSLVHAQNFPYHMYSTLQTPTPRPAAVPPQQTYMVPPPQQTVRYRSEWDSYDTHTDDLTGPATVAGYEFRFTRDDQAWVGGEYYDATYGQTYDQSTYLEEPNTSPDPGPSTILPQEGEESDQTRGRKRVRQTGTPAPPASTLVVNRAPPARSPSPPTRVIKSTYGGNLFTADDVEYLKKYIDYCQEQGLALSLREICERIAVKAPHHTFYSWRRYCNKHRIRLGGYTLARGESPDDEEQSIHTGPEPGAVAAAQRHMRSQQTLQRSRSPTPPRALYRSTTGKGVAFTGEDIMFLVSFMEYRKSQGRLDMVAFWKDVAAKAPHHSRASWMKYWRRHKHELHPIAGDEPPPMPPDKKMRYSREDDLLLAQFFCNKPEGTSDQIFQAFARQHPHHPWKGWQEHHRIHKTKIDHYTQQLMRGEPIEVEEL